MRATRTTRLRTALALPAAALALTALSGCAGSKGTSTDSPAVTSPTAGSPSSPASTASGSTPTTAAVDQTIRVTVKDGKVSGPSGRVKVKAGSTVALVVTSDVADEVHLHTYDKHVDVPAGGTVTLTFTASITGIVEAELESRSLTLVRMEIA